MNAAFKTAARRIAAGAALIAAPALIAIGTAAASQADTAVPHAASSNIGPSISHPAFPNQTDTPQPGSAVHHHHQWNHAK